jgi:hypothetical protein
MLGPVVRGCDGFFSSCQFQSTVTFAKRYSINVHCWILKLQLRIVVYCLLNLRTKQTSSDIKLQVKQCIYVKFMIFW